MRANSLSFAAPLGNIRQTVLIARHVPKSQAKLRAVLEGALKNHFLGLNLGRFPAAEVSGDQHPVHRIEANVRHGFNFGARLFISI